MHLNGNIKTSDLVKSKTSDPTINSKVHGEVEHNKNFTQLDQEIEDKPTVKVSVHTHRTTVLLFLIHFLPLLNVTINIES